MKEALGYRGGAKNATDSKRETYTLIIPNIKFVFLKIAKKYYPPQG